MQWVHQGKLVQFYGRAGLPNPPAPACPRVEIVSTKHFFPNATWTGAYGDIEWVGVLQPNAETSEYGTPEHAACGLAAHTPCGALYQCASEIATSSIEHTVCSMPTGSKSGQIVLE